MMVENSKVGKVKDFIRKEIKAGRIRNGQRLPSCREVSAKLSVNKITVNKAYNELERVLKSGDKNGCCSTAGIHA